jgi:pimeloyl-ACP methyl ester carboxylesterase
VGDIAIHFKPELWVRRKLGEAYADPAMVTDERVKRTAELQRFPGNQEAALRRARTQGPLDPTQLKRLAVPTLILWGAKDRWVPVSDAFKFRDDIKGARLEIFAEFGHDSMEEDPKATATAVAAFLDRLSDSHGRVAIRRPGKYGRRKGS